MEALHFTLEGMPVDNDVHMADDCDVWQVGAPCTRSHVLPAVLVMCTTRPRPMANSTQPAVLHTPPIWTPSETNLNKVRQRERFAETAMGRDGQVRRYQVYIAPPLFTRACFHPSASVLLDMRVEKVRASRRTGNHKSPSTPAQST